MYSARTVCVCVSMCVWVCMCVRDSGSAAKRGSLDNYHHGISQPCSISCYFWAILFEVSLCFICLSLNTAGRLGQARQLSSLTVGLFSRCWLFLQLTTRSPLLAGLRWYPVWECMISPLSPLCLLSLCLCCSTRRWDPWLQQSQQSMSSVRWRIPWVTSHIN